MQCEQFEQLLEQEPDGSLPPAAALHLKDCPDCNLLWEDLKTIQQAGYVLGAEDEDMDPPERVWTALRFQLESQGLIREPQPAGWWAGWLAWRPSPVLAGSYLAMLLVAASLISRNGYPGAATFPITHKAAISPAPLVAGLGNMLDGNFKRVMESLPQRDVALADSFQHNLGIVDNLIAVCEKSV